MGEKLNITVLGEETALLSLRRPSAEGPSGHLCELPHLEKSIEGSSGQRQSNSRSSKSWSQGRFCSSGPGDDRSEGSGLDAEVILVVVPAFAQRPFAEASVPI